MSDSIESLVLDLVEWVAKKERSYTETMDAWRTSCPRLSIWEDAIERGFIGMAWTEGGLVVKATPAGLDFLKKKRAHCFTA